MPTSAETVYFVIRADRRQLPGDMKAARQEAVSEAKKMGTDVAKASQGFNYKKLGDDALGFANKTKYASGIAALALYGASEAASDLNETTSFTNVTFKESGDAMERWSERSLESMGIARESALDAANQFGGLFQITGSTADESARLSKEMVQLAVDMSSAKNVSLDEAVLALGSGLRGEAEPLRRFNVLLSEAAIQAQAVKMGIAEEGAELDETQKVQARYGLILEQTSDIQGDYARTADSAANQQRRAQEAAKDAAATLGQSLAPITAEVAGLAADLATGFSALPDPLQKTAVVIAGLVAVASPASAAIGGVARVIDKLKNSQKAAAALDVVSTSTSAMRVAFDGAAAALGLSAGGLLAIVTAAAAAGTAIYMASEEAQRAEAELMATSVGAIEVIGQQAEAGIRTRDELVASIKREIDWLKEEGANEEELANAREAGKKALKSYDTSTRVYVQTGQGVVETTERMADSVFRFARMTGEEFKEWREGTVDNFERVDNVFDRLADKSHLTADEIIRALNRAIRSQLDFERNWRVVVQRAGRDGDDFLKWLQEKYGSEAPQIIAALANANRKQFDSIISKWEQSQGIAAHTNRQIQRSFITTENEIDQARAAVDEWNEALRRVPGQIRTVVSQDLPKGEPAITGTGSAHQVALAATKQFPGLMITSGYRAGSKGFHGDVRNPAQDLAKPGWPDDESGIFNTDAKSIYDWLTEIGGREIIYGRWQWQGGREIGYSGGDHWGHVHYADQGGHFRVRGPALVKVGAIEEDFLAVPRSGPHAVGGGKTEISNYFDFSGAYIGDPEQLMEMVEDAAGDALEAVMSGGPA